MTKTEQLILTLSDIKALYRSDSLPRHWWQGWLCHVIDQPSSFLITHDDHVLTPKQRQLFDEGITKMRQGVPLAYLTGEQAFFGRSFAVNEHTLIPRPDTERLIEVVLDWAAKSPLDAGCILDLGTGSGCIAITLAKELPSWQVLAVDFSDEALKVASDNAKRLSANHCQFVRSNWFENIEGAFDVIVSNPPYIAQDDEHLATLVAEPITALVAKDDGLYDIEIIASQAQRFLNKDGLLAVEHGHDQGVSVRQIFDKYGYDDIKTIQDYGGNDRLTVGVRGMSR